MFNLFKSNKQSDHDAALQKYQDAVNQAHHQAMQQQKDAMAKAMMMNAKSGRATVYGGSGASIMGGGSGGGGSIAGFTHTITPGQVIGGMDGTTIKPIGTGTCSKCGYENDIQNVYCYLCNDKLNFKEITMTETVRLKVDATGRAGGWYGTSGTSA